MQTETALQKQREQLFEYMVSVQQDYNANAPPRTDGPRYTLKVQWTRSNTGSQGGTDAKGAEPAKGAEARDPGKGAGGLSRLIKTKKKQGPDRPLKQEEPIDEVEVAQARPPPGRFFRRTALRR